MSDDTTVLLAIANLRTEVMQRLTDNVALLRDRLDDAERRHTIDLKEAIIKVWERIELMQRDIYSIRSEATKSDAGHQERRASDYKSVAMIVAGVLINIGLIAFQYVFHTK